MAEDGKELRDASAPPALEAKPDGSNAGRAAEEQPKDKDYVSGSLPSPVSAKFLLFALFSTLILIAGLLLLANHVSGVAAFVDASFFQLILTLLTCFVIGVFIFGFTAGATARMRITPGAKYAIDFGGAIAAVAGLFLIVLPNLSPTTTLTIYLRDGSGSANAAQSEFSVPEGVDVVLQLAEGRTVKTVMTEAQFGLLPKGVNIPMTVASPRWGMVGLEPPDCVAPSSGQFTVKAGCRTVWLRLAQKTQAKFTSLADLPPTGLGFGDRQDVSLRTAINALASELQKAATERDASAYVATPDWTTLGAPVADGSFPWRPVPSGARACAVVRLIEQAFNDAHPDAEVFVILQVSAIQVQRKQTAGVRPNDACG